jgi:hypothetical protein
VMAPVDLLNTRRIVCRSSLAENVTGYRGGLSRTGGEDAGENACRSAQCNPIHDNSFFELVRATLNCLRGLVHDHIFRV